MLGLLENKHLGVKVWYPAKVSCPGYPGMFIEIWAPAYIVTIDPPIVAFTVGVSYCHIDPDQCLWQPPEGAIVSSLS